MSDRVSFQLIARSIAGSPGLLIMKGSTEFCLFLLSYWFWERQLLNDGAYKRTVSLIHSKYISLVKF